MPSENKTPNYHLSQWAGNEYLKREDLVNDFEVIDGALKDNADAAVTAQSTADAAIPKDTATAADQALVSTGNGTWAAKTLTQFKAWLALTATNISDFAATVRGTVLTGLSTATNVVITAADTALSAFGKLQAQITANLTTLTNHTGLTNTAHGATSEATASTLIARDANGRAKIAIPSAMNDIASLITVAKAGPWKLLQNYLVAGTYIYTVPDLYGDGLPYEIGVYEVGGGGGGAATSTYDDPSSAYGSVASGGASGRARCFLLTVTPGQNITLVIGTGGARVSGHGQGNNGGSTSFGGIVVEGGQGGKMDYRTSQPYIAGSDGGQGSDASPARAIAPAMGEPTLYSIGNYNGITGNGGRTRILECLNIFNGLRYLGAGGSVSAWMGTGSASASAQTAQTLDDGLRAGSGAAYGGEPNNVNVTAESATSPGSGGGSAMNYVHGSPVGSVLSGAGAPGAVMIYVRKAA